MKLHARVYRKAKFSIPLKLREGEFHDEHFTSMDDAQIRDYGIVVKPRGDPVPDW